MTFSWKQQKLDAIKIKQRRARVQSKAGHPDMKILHPGWVRDAQLKDSNYALINKSVKEEVEKKQLRNELFTRKLHSGGGIIDG